MKIQVLATATLLSGLIGLLDPAAGDAFGQDNPFAAPDAAGEAAPAADAPAEAEGIDEDDPALRNPTVQAVLDQPRETPVEKFQVAVLLTDLGYPRLAKPILEQLDPTQINQETLAGMVDHMGSASFLRLAHNESLAPAAGVLADAVLAAVDARARNPERIASLLEELESDDPAVRRAAIVDLKAARTAGVSALLSALADPARAEHHAHYRQALVALGALAEPQLLGALESTDGRFKSQVILALAGIGSQRSLLRLAGFAYGSDDETVRAAARAALEHMVGGMPHRSTVAEATEDRVLRYVNGARPLPATFSGEVPLWHWNDQKRQSFSISYPEDEVGMVIAARLGRNLVSLQPSNPRYLRLHVATELEAEKLRLGYGRPLPSAEGSVRAKVAGYGTATIEEVLLLALEKDMLGAAAAACTVLGDIGRRGVLVTAGGEPSPLAAATGHADRRVRLAAVGAIMKLSPETPYAGSSNVSDALRWFVQTTGTPGALVAHPRLGRAQDLAGLLNSLGFNPATAATGRSLFLQAVESADAQLILVHIGVSNPDLRETLYSLRRDAHTARLPIGLIADIDRLAQANALARQDPRMIAFARPHDTSSMQSIVDRLRSTNPRQWVLEGELLSHAEQALDWLHALARSEQRIYDLRPALAATEGALLLPELGEKAALVLGEAGTAAAQTALVNTASQPTLKTGLRKAAAEAFAHSVVAHGILLESDQILTQYDRYNASRDTDQVTQTILGYLLDVIETPRRVRLGQQVQLDR